ncbi:MAG: Tim44 domain-containing protein [Desulfobulbus sp.]|jgi:predicted lipid-binding transport protein (Tim44 family)
MPTLLRRCTPFFFIFFLLACFEASITTDYADARPRAGGRSFSSPAQRAPKQQVAPRQQMNQSRPQQAQPGGFGRGLMGGLIGGALGGLLFGSLFGAGGSGPGILPLILLAVAGYFLYKRFINRPAESGGPRSQGPPSSLFQREGGQFGSSSMHSPIPPIRDTDPLSAGLAEIRQTDPGFDEKYFLEVASDVFFKVQAGWIRRDLDASRHLLGNQLAQEYAQHFEEMKAKGYINKLESIAVRKVEIAAAGSENGEDFVTVLFTANLLDYTVDDTTGELIDGSMTEPVKFAEKWTWARPIRTEDWKLEGIEVVND